MGVRKRPKGTRNCPQCKRVLDQFGICRTCQICGKRSCRRCFEKVRHACVRCIDQAVKGMIKHSKNVDRILAKPRVP